VKDDKDDTQEDGPQKNGDAPLDPKKENVMSVDKDYDDVVGIVYDDDDFFANENVDMVVV
jgi:hypothetical protein